MAACLMFKAATDEVRRHAAANHVGRNSLDVINVNIRRALLSERILALQRVAQHSGEHTIPPAVVQLPKPAVAFRIRVGKVVRSRWDRRRGCNEKPELAEQEEADRRHALAQKLIAKRLKQADRRPRRIRRVKIALLFQTRNLIRISRPGISMSACMRRWLRLPLERLAARIVSLAASKLVDLCRSCDGRQHTNRVTYFPFDDNVPLLPICEAC